jgi:oligopeptide transport system substrate-binding protein
MRRMLAFIAIALLCGVAAPWSFARQAAITGPVVVLGLPRTIDPVKATRLDEFRLVTALFEPLVRLDPATLAPVPGLAERWEISPDQLTWIFHLDPRARWSDGRPVLAADMRRGLLRHLIVQSPNAFYLDGLLAGSSLAERDPELRRVALERDCGLRCDDDHTLAVRLAHPAPYLTAILSLAAFVPATAEQADDGDLARQAAVWTDPTAIVGNGPLLCRGHLPRHHYDFVPSPTYGGAHPARGPVRALIVENPGTALRLYLSGEADAILLLPADAVGDLKRGKVPGLQQSASLSTAYLRVRVVPRPTDNAAITTALRHPRLRRALATAIDRETLCGHLLQGNAAPATTFVPGELSRYLPYHAPTEVLATDIARAREDLAAARADLGSLPDLDVVVPSQPAERLSAGELVVDQWRRNLGLSAHLTILPQTELRSREKAIDYDCALAIWLGDFLDPTTFLDCFRTDGGANRTGFADPAYDALLDRAAASGGEQRWRLLEQAERRLVEFTPLIPLYHNSCSFLVRPGLGGIKANLLEIVNFDAIGWDAR